jgi:hypothetical protein
MGINAKTSLKYTVQNRTLQSDPDVLYSFVLVVHIVNGCFHKSKKTCAGNLLIWVIKGDGFGWLMVSACIRIRPILNGRFWFWYRKNRICITAVSYYSFLCVSRLKVERKRKLLKAKLIKLKEEGGGGGAAVASPLDETASQAEFRKQKKAKEFR